MSESPTVSVILPVYNCARYVGVAIESILKQTFEDFEFIVIDDGSKDESLMIIKAYAERDSRIRVVAQANMGLAASLNRGIELARGELIARQDHDDVSLPTRLEKQVRYMNTHPKVGLLGTWAEIQIDDQPSGRYHRHPTDPDELRYDLLLNNPFVHSSVMFRKRIVQEVGGYCTDRNRQPPEDYELWSRLSRRVEVANLPEVLLVYRELSTSMSRAAVSPFLLKLITICSENIAERAKLKPDHKAVRQIATLAHGAQQILTERPDPLAITRVYRQATTAVVPGPRRREFLRIANHKSFTMYLSYWEPRFQRAGMHLIFRIIRKTGYLILQLLRCGRPQP